MVRMQPMMFHYLQQPMISTTDEQIMDKIQGTRLRKTSQNIIVLSDGAPRLLGPDFTPGPGDVICARGKLAFNHPGNKYFRYIVSKMHESYKEAETKLQRSIVVSEVVDMIRSKGLGFVKKNSNGQWIEVGDRLSREKVGQMLRDSLGTVYKSSAKAKKRRRTENSVKICSNIENVLKLLSSDVSQTMTQLSHDIRQPNITDDEALELFTRANCNLLDAFKRDKSLVTKFFQHEGKNNNKEEEADDEDDSVDSITGTTTSTAMEVASTSHFGDDDDVDNMMIL